ncbi:MAG: GNAT family N-acetyltransferase [Reyranella sp.]
MALIFELRPSRPSDLDFCWPIYREPMQPLTEALTQWNEAAQRKLVEQAVGHAGTSILKAENADAGWLQVEETGGSVQLRHLYLAAPMRNRGLGSAFLVWMKDRADRKRKDLVLEVMTNNPAQRLYERLGFKPLTTEGNKLTMRY